MAPVTLPPTFHNSFWSSDYRSGLETLFNQLDGGCKEAEDLAEFIESQSKGHHALAGTLLTPPLHGSASQSTSSLQHTLLSLRGASSARGEAHRALAIELESRILIGFRQWQSRHEDRVSGARKEVLGKGGVVGTWEKEAAKLNSGYVNRSRAADDSEDDAKFAPATVRSPPPPRPPSVSSQDGYTSPPLKFANLKRTGTVADRISEKLRAASITSPTAGSPLSPAKNGNGVAPFSRLNKPVLSIDGKMLPPPPSPFPPGTPNDGHRSPTSPTSPNEDAFIPPTDPDGRPTFGPAVPAKEGDAVVDVQPPPILLSGLSLSAAALKDMLKRFDAYLLTTPAPNADPSIVSTKSNPALASRHRTSMLGTFEKTFSGDEVANWLKSEIEGFGGDWERSVDAARELNSMGYLSRTGVGRGFDPSPETYYILRSNPTADPSPVSALSSAALERININVANINVPSALSPSSTSTNIQSMIKSYVPARFAPSDEPQHVRLRKEAQKADEAYKEGVKLAEVRRLEMEEKIERGLRVWERWERERLTVLHQVLKQYESALSRLPTRLAALQEGTTLSVEAFNPDADLKALIEGNRTGPFRPQPHVYESLEVDVPEVNFGIDLRKWAGDAGWRSATQVPKREKGSVPQVLQALLEAIDDMGKDISHDGQYIFETLPSVRLSAREPGYVLLADSVERRKSWIYEIPLSETHALQSSLNNAELSVHDMVEIVKTFNVPVAAGTVKLWLLELTPPLLGWEGWEDAKAIYPSVGADQERDMTSAVGSVLGRLAGIQIFVLDAILRHLRDMIDKTESPEVNEIYITKLSLSLGRCILRPQTETDLTIGDRTPSLFTADLLNLNSTVLPPLIEKKKKEADRVMPVRKRTALVDQRISRRNISEDDDRQVLLERQLAMQHPNHGREKSADITPSNSQQLSSSTSTALPAASIGLEAPIAPAVSSQANQADIRHSGPSFGAPMMAEPKDSDDESDPVRVIPPSPNPNAAAANGNSYRMPSNQHEVEGDSSATADILESLGAQLAGEDDAPIPGTGGGPGSLKRATSGEGAGSSASRLRGPRGARGPRPSGTRAQGTSIAGMSGVEAPTEGERATSPQPGSKPGGHRVKGSVSAMAARFESS